MPHLHLAQANQQKAFDIIEQCQIRQAWQSIGAQINLIGSLKMGLLVKHRDIDFHIYTPALDVAQSFAAMAQIAKNPKIVHIEYRNLLNEKDSCLEWHAWYQDEEEWQIDMIHIVQGSKYAGYFEKQAERILAVMNEQQRETILRLKFETPDEIKIAGIEIYQAVIESGITTFDELQQWRANRAQNGIIEWIPS
ncbi:phosphoglycerate mutase family protein [Helicobacter sp.]|uniref:phosphoglycerate mutase family protein n=1 Tax=Helicobacter sp. TaxID=218 RepID=UPI0019BD71AD|nr:phosphoglycerate mutase family protein [Helicobacter sp.]MBD5164922.1 phosphoglycerate mutase family protein [Helicobacter sp.]